MGEEKKALKYVVKLAANEDVGRVTDLVRRFFVDEPLSVFMDNGTSSFCDQFEQYCAETVREGVSLMAVSPTGDLLGVNINGILTREASTATKNGGDWNCSHPKCLKIRELLGLASSESDVFGAYPEVDRVLEIRVGLVAPAFRRQGISAELRRRTVALARELSIPLVKTDCASAFSARAVAGLGFSCVFSLRYSDHLGPDGRPFFNPAAPHDRLQTYVYHVREHRPKELPNQDVSSNIK